MQTRLEQCLIGVDVADAGDDRLVEQERLQTSLRPFESLMKIVGIQLEWLGAQLAVCEESIEFRPARIEGNAAEAPDIAKTQLARVVQREDNVRVRFARPVRD